MPPTDRGLANLSNNNASDEFPDWSPDGSKIVFSGTRVNTSNLWTMNSDGTGQTSVGSPNVYAAAVWPAWSPDGTKIAYAANWGLGSEQLWWVAADGSNYGENGTKLTQDPGNPLNAQRDWRPVHPVTMKVQPKSGPAGTPITISGSGFLAKDKVKLVFKDANGVKAVLGTVMADGTGSFSFNSTVPAGAAPGKAKVSAAAQSGLAGKASFTVTAWPDRRMRREA